MPRSGGGVLHETDFEMCSSLAADPSSSATFPCLSLVREKSVCRGTDACRGAQGRWGCCRRGVEHANVRTVLPSTLAGETSEPCPALMSACLGPVCTASVPKAASPSPHATRLPLFSRETNFEMCSSTRERSSDAYGQARFPIERVRIATQIPNATSVRCVICST